MLVQQTIGNYSGANGATATGTLSITPHATGSLLLVGCFQVGQTTAPTVSDPTNGSYAQIVNTIGFGSAGNGSLFWVKNTTTSALTITATFPGSTGWAMVVVEITGQTASPIGSHSTGNSWATET